MSKRSWHVRLSNGYRSTSSQPGRMKLGGKRSRASSGSWRFRGRILHRNFAISPQKWSMHSFRAHAESQLESVGAEAVMEVTSVSHRGSRCLPTPGLMMEHVTPSSNRASRSVWFMVSSILLHFRPQSSWAMHLLRNAYMFFSVAMKKSSQYSGRKEQPLGQSANCVVNSFAIVAISLKAEAISQSLTSFVHSTMRAVTSVPRISSSVSFTFSSIWGPARHVQTTHQKHAALA
mmetsp:Transcript_6657/g.18193  ORF Transcript_6657/g.18193 Transcript_6657/m.18193 type:complete len:233 (-) Transcript_6657:86-784(-)